MLNKEKGKMAQGYWAKAWSCCKITRKVKPNISNTHWFPAGSLAGFKKKLRKKNRDASFFYAKNFLKNNKKKKQWVIRDQKMHFDFSEEFLERFHTGRLNARVRQTEAASDKCTLACIHTQTNNKSQSFSPDTQIKTKRPPEDHIIWVVRARDSFITGVWNADQARGTLLHTPRPSLKPLPTILSYKSFLAFSLSFSPPPPLHSVSGGLLILAPFTLGWTRWAPDFWHYPSTLSCGIDLASLLLGIHCLPVSAALIGRCLYVVFRNFIYVTEAAVTSPWPRS